MAKQQGKTRRLREQILEKAAQLFIQNGYDRATVQQVIDALGISKGAFYHYFSSKEELLDAVADQMTRQGLDAVRPIFEDRSVSALDRFILYLKVSRERRLGQMSLIGAMLRVLHRDENAIIRQKINRRVVEGVTPLFADLIAEGVAEGVFYTPDPDEAATMLLQLGNVYVETTVPLMLNAYSEPGGVELIRRRIDFYLDAYERILGLTAGALPRMDESRVRLILDLMHSSEIPTAPPKEVICHGSH